MIDIKEAIKRTIIKFQKDEKKKLNPIHEIVNTFYIIRGKHKMPKEFYAGRWGYSKLAREAKKLYAVYNENISDCLWALDRMNYESTKGSYDWSISTCYKKEKLHRSN